MNPFSIATTSSLIQKLIDPLVMLAIQAGDLIMTHYHPGIDVRQKTDRSPVTIADEAAEELIVAGLERLAPDIPIIAEEAVTAGRIPPIGSIYFLVDPLDGTREFINRNGEFTVNIALVENLVPVLGVVYAPALGRLFAGYSGHVFEQMAGHRTPISARPPPPTGMTAMASRSHRDPSTQAILDKYPVREIRSAGSSLKFCILAAGEADLYPRPGRTMEWDTAAGDAILRAAGGRVTLMDGITPLHYGKAADGFANPHFLAFGAPPI